MLPNSLQRPSVLISLLFLLCAMSASDARADGSEASALSTLPVAVMSQATGTLLSAGATLTVVAVEASGDGVVWVLERASDGARATLKVAGSAAGHASVVAGTSIEVGALAAGWVLTSAGRAVACIPDAIGSALLYNERVTR